MWDVEVGWRLWECLGLVRIVEDGRLESGVNICDCDLRWKLGSAKEQCDG